MRDRLPFLSLLTLVSLGTLLLGTVGCRNVDRVERQDVGLSLRSSLPLEGARPKLEAARQLDPSLRLGFYSVPTEADGADPALAEMRTQVVPVSWSRPGREVFRDGQWLVVIQSSDVHDRIGPWATDRRRAIASASDLIQSEVRILTFRNGAAPVIARLGLEPFETGGDSVAYIADDAAIQGLLDSAGVETVSAPRIATIDGQRGTVSVYSQQAYVSDYEVFHVDEDWIAEPVIEVLQDGIMVEITARLVAENRVDFEASVRITELLAMTETTLALDPSLDPVTVQVPELRELFFTERAVLDNGGSILVGSAGSATGGETWVLLRAQRVERKDTVRP